MWGFTDVGPPGSGLWQRGSSGLDCQPESQEPHLCSVPPPHYCFQGFFLLEFGLFCEAWGRSLLSTKPGFSLTGHQGQTQLGLEMGSFILLDLEVIQVCGHSSDAFQGPSWPLQRACLGHGGGWAALLCLGDGSQKKHNPPWEEWSTILPVHPAQERLHATLDTRLPPSLPSSLCPTEVCYSQNTMLKANMESCQQPGHYSKEEDQRRKKNQEGGGKSASLLTFASNTRLRGERLLGRRGEPHCHMLGCGGGMHHVQNRRAADQ